MEKRNLHWNYVPFKDLISWEHKSTIKSRDGKQSGKYKFFVCSNTDIKRCDTALINRKALIFGTGGKASVHYCSEPFSYSTDCVVAIQKDSNVNLKFLFYYFKQNNLSLLQKDFTGSGLQHTSKKKIGEILVPKITYEEQERIVARIEELFSELDKAVETLKTTKQQLAVYRQAVLKEAFEGKYTSKWRKQHTDISPMSDFNSIKLNSSAFKDTSSDENSINLNLPVSWFQIRLGEIFEVEVGATPSRRTSEYWGGNISWVSSGEVHFNEINDTKECITENGLKNCSTNLQPIGTVMLAMIGEGKTRGQAAILNIPAAHNQNTAAILVSKTPCQPKYVYYFLKANYDNIRHIGSGNNQKALNKERVRALRFPFTSFEEQKIIVREIESRLFVCDQIEKTIEQSLQQAEAMRQSILKQAFEGRL